MVAGDETGNGDGAKSDGDGDKSNSIQGSGEGNGDAMVRPIPTTTFDVRGSGGQQPPSSRAPRVMLGGQWPGPCRAVP